MLLWAVGARAQGTNLPAGTERVTGGRFTFVATPADIALARNLLADAIAKDTFPGLARPSGESLWQSRRSTEL